MSELAEKHVVISGGGSGVGAEIAGQYARAGAKVSILGRRLEPLEKVAEKIDASAFSCDVTDRESIDKAVQSAQQENGPIAICIANAGAAVSKPFAKMTVKDFTSMHDVNVLGVFNLWQACFEQMKASGWGRLIAIASTAGLKGYPYVAGYCAAKHGVVGLTRALALELARTGITVNAICPSFVDTPMLDESIANIVQKTGLSPEDAANTLKAANPMKRFIEVDEVAETALWLSSNGARSINGQTISINGGEA